MEDKKILNSEELEKVTGGYHFSPADEGVLARCSCGGEITLNCNVRTNKDGKMELKCPNCGIWFVFE